MSSRPLSGSGVERIGRSVDLQAFRLGVLASLSIGRRLEPDTERAMERLSSGIQATRALLAERAGQVEVRA